jgi:multiple sugar transport system permease protein
MNKQSKPTAFLIYVLAIIVSILYLVPYYIIVRNALMTQSEIAAFDWIFWADAMKWENLVNLFNDPIAPMGVGLKNSAIISFFQVGGQLIITSLAGYGLARVEYKWSDQVFYIILIALMVPPAAIFVQMFLVVDMLGWVNTYQGLIEPGIFNVF